MNSRNQSTWINKPVTGESLGSSNYVSTFTVDILVHWGAEEAGLLTCPPSLFKSIETILWASFLVMS